MVQALQENIEKLISAYEAEKARADRVEAEAEKLKRQYEAARKKNVELEEKVEDLSLRCVFADGASDNSQARERIDGLIREIDSALELLK